MEPKEYSSLDLKCDDRNDYLYPPIQRRRVWSGTIFGGENRDNADALGGSSKARR